MAETARLLDQLRRAFDGDAWSGPSLMNTLDGFGAGPAAAHPWPGSHSIHEIVRHLTTWTLTVARRVETRQNLAVVAEDWPAVPAADEAAWPAALAALRRAHEQLLAAVAALADDELDLVLGAVRDRPAGAGVSLYVLLHGAAQHYLYHAGQVALLRKYT